MPGTSRLAFNFYSRVPAGLRRNMPLGLKKLGVVALYSGHAARRPLDTVRYLLFESETNNFTYEITNQRELAQLVSRVTGCGEGDALRVFDELLGDKALAAAVHEKLRLRRDRNPYPRFGRRIVWYAIVRLLKPRFVVETGVHDGLGSIALLRALERNAEEGHQGRLLGTDIDPTAGWMIPEDLKERFRIVFGDSVQTLSRAADSIGVFVHDSDHHYEYEAAEYAAIRSKLEPGAVLISDNAHDSTALKEFAQATGRIYAYSREVSTKHFYPGAGVGVASPPRP